MTNLFPLQLAESSAMVQHKAAVKNHTQVFFFFYSGVTAPIGSIVHHGNGRANIQHVNTII